MEHIIAVAIKYDNRIWQLPRPKRHHDVMRSIGGMFGPHIEGFISSTGEFVNRTEAMRIAVAAGQLRRRSGPEYYQGPELYSEDLW